MGEKHEVGERMGEEAGNAGNQGGGASGNQAGGQQGGDGKQQGAGGTGGGQQQQGGEKIPDHLIPKGRFDEVNTKLTTATAELDRLNAELKKIDPKAAEKLTTQLEQERTSATAKVVLTRLGVTSDRALNFLVSEYNALPEKNRPKFEDWAKEQKESEPAFFGGGKSQTANSSAGSGTQTQQRRPLNTDAGKDGSNSGSAGDPPLTEELIRRMSVSDYKRRRAEIATFQAAQSKR